jgi:hypothetical protein
LGGDGEGEVSLRVTWGQGGRDRITSKEGFQVSKKGMEEGTNKELARGVKKGELRHSLHCQSVYVYIMIV